MQETLNSKKKGDAAFRQKDFKTAIDSYTQVTKFLDYIEEYIKSLARCM